MMVSPAEGRVTSHYGPRPKHPVTGKAGFHRGIDVAPPVPGTRGEPLYAALDGVVRLALSGVRKVGNKWPNNPITASWNTGNCIVITTDAGPTLYYGHADTITVKTGQRVKAGDVIGTMGDSGNVTGVHLHFEVWSTSDPYTHYNPVALFKEFGIEPGSAPKLIKSETVAFDVKDVTDEKHEKDEIMQEFLFISTDAKGRKHHYGTMAPAHYVYVKDEDAYIKGREAFGRKVKWWENAAKDRTVARPREAFGEYIGPADAAPEGS